MKGNNRRVSCDAICFDIFAVEHIPKEITKLIESKNIITNVYSIQAYKPII